MTVSSISKQPSTLKELMGQFLPLLAVAGPTSQNRMGHVMSRPCLRTRNGSRMVEMIEVSSILLLKSDKAVVTPESLLSQFVLDLPRSQLPWNGISTGTTPHLLQSSLLTDLWVSLIGKSFLRINTFTDFFALVIDVSSFSCFWTVLVSTVLSTYAFSYLWLLISRMFLGILTHAYLWSLHISAMLFTPMSIHVWSVIVGTLIGTTSSTHFWSLSIGSLLFAYLWFVATTHTIPFSYFWAFPVIAFIFPYFWALSTSILLLAMPFSYFWTTSVGFYTYFTGRIQSSFLCFIAVKELRGSRPFLPTLRAAFLRYNGIHSKGQLLAITPRDVSSIASATTLSPPQYTTNPLPMQVYPTFVQSDFNGKCAYCMDNFAYYIDRVDPNKGLDRGNVVPICGACQVHKAKTWKHAEARVQAYLAGHVTFRVEGLEWSDEDHMAALAKGAASWITL